MNNTIVALATPPMNSAIHIIRVSGPKTYEIINSICNTNVTRKSYAVQKVDIVDDKKVIDHVLLIKFVSPRSFTGEDIIEINCHGGIFLANTIVKLLIKRGCKIAQPGEFSQRAFMNNKLTLLEAESINNLINASNLTAVHLANAGLSPTTYKTLTTFKKELFLLIGQVEINIDYPEYNDVPQITKSAFKKRISNLISQIKQIINSSKQAVVHYRGVNVAIVGEPNAGKSSLLNAFVNESRAIVSSIPGTTRDVIGEKVNIGGITLNFLDTAGIRRGNNTIEKLGISKTIETIKQADLVLYVIDASKATAKLNTSILDLLKSKKYLVILNKTDLPTKTEIQGIKISAKNSKISSLVQCILKQVQVLSINNESVVLLPSERSIGLIEQVLNNLTQVEHMMKSNEPIDLSMELLHNCLSDIQNILGENKENNFYDELFRNFCVGK